MSLSGKHAIIVSRSPWHLCISKEFMNVKPKFKPGTLGIGRQVSDALGPKSPPPHSSFFKQTDWIRICLLIKRGWKFKIACLSEGMRSGTPSLRNNHWTLRILQAYGAKGKHGDQICSPALSSPIGHCWPALSAACTHRIPGPWKKKQKTDMLMSDCLIVGSTWDLACIQFSGCSVCFTVGEHLMSTLL